MWYILLCDSKMVTLYSMATLLCDSKMVKEFVLCVENQDAGRDITVWNSARCTANGYILVLSPAQQCHSGKREQTDEATLLEHRAGHRFQWRTQPMWRSPCELAINLYSPITPVCAAPALTAIAVSVVFFNFLAGGRGGGGGWGGELTKPA